MKRQHLIIFFNFNEKLLCARLGAEIESVHLFSSLFIQARLIDGQLCTRHPARSEVQSRQCTYPLIDFVSAEVLLTRHCDRQ